MTDRLSLPKHDTVVTVPAGDGWVAHVALRGDETVVGLVVVPADRRRVPGQPDLRAISLTEARAKAVSMSANIDLAAAREQVLQARRKLPPRRQAESAKLSKDVHSPVAVVDSTGVTPADADLALVAVLVLVAQREAQPRYTYVRGELKRLGYNFSGAKPEGRVKDLIQRATAAGYLAPSSSGRGHRKPGPRLEGVRTWRVWPAETTPYREGDPE